MSPPAEGAGLSSYRLCFLFFFFDLPFLLQSQQ
jgi:hypothetical protein